MNLYMISQTENNDYDTYYLAIVRAPDEETAKNMDPETGQRMKFLKKNYRYHRTWAYSSDGVTVKLIGTSIDDTPGIVCASSKDG